MWPWKSKEELLLELIDVMQMRKRFGKVIDRVRTDSEAITTILSNNNMPDTTAYINEVFEIGPYELATAISQLYNIILTRKDVKGMIRFYKYGPGKKFMDNLPALEESTSTIFDGWVNGAYKGIIKFADAELSKAEATFDDFEKLKAAIPDSTKIH